MRSAKIDHRPSRDDPRRVNPRMAGVVMPLDLREVHRLRHSRHLVQLARIVRQMRIRIDQMQVAFEMDVIDRIETNQCRK